MSVRLTPVSIVPRKTMNQTDMVAQISEHLLRDLQIEMDREVTFSLGKKSINLKVEPIEMVQNQIHLSEKIVQEFCLPFHPLKLQVNYIRSANTLWFGPIIGLLTDFHPNEKSVPHFRSIHVFCEELHHSCQENGGLFYVFSLKDFPNNGYYFHNGNWVFSELPLPDVIYNRIHSRRLEQSKPFKKLRKNLAHLSIPFFNDRFLSKWEVHEQLLQEKYLHSYMPETKIFSKENLLEFAKKFKIIFIKPIHGSQGRNIIKILQDQDHFSYQASFSEKNISIETVVSLDEMYNQIKQLAGNRIYIIQQGIGLLESEGCPMDFRVLCHKSMDGVWSVTSVVARISAEQEFVSNLAKGGQIIRPVHALSPWMDKRTALELIALMKELALETAAIISRHSEGITGELGIDIGVDDNSRLWIIEVNSKPSKSFEDGLKKIRPSAKAIIQFCTMLALDKSIVKEEK